MASLPAATNILPAGVDITTPSTAAAATQTLANDGRSCLLIKNGNAGTIVATLVNRIPVNDGSSNLTITSRTVSITTAKYFLIGPFAPSIYNDTNGETTVNLDIFSSVLVQPLRLTAQV